MRTNAVSATASQIESDEQHDDDEQERPSRRRSLLGCPVGGPLLG